MERHPLLHSCMFLGRKDSFDSLPKEPEGKPNQRPEGPGHLSPGQRPGLGFQEHPKAEGLVEKPLEPRSLCKAFSLGCLGEGQPRAMPGASVV